MRLQLTRRWTKRLRALPEQAMGVQRVDVTLRSGQRMRDIIVFNAEEAQWPPTQTKERRSRSPTSRTSTPQIGNGKRQTGNERAGQAMRPSQPEKIPELRSTQRVP